MNPNNLRIHKSVCRDGFESVGYKSQDTTSNEASVDNARNISELSKYTVCSLIYFSRPL